MKTIDTLTSFFKKKTVDNLDSKKQDLENRINQAHEKMKNATHISDIDALEREVRPLQLELENLEK